MTTSDVRSIDAFCVDESGTVHGFFPPGPNVFPIGAAEVAALDAAVREAAATCRVVVAGRVEDWFPERIDTLDRYVRERLPAFERALLTELAPVTTDDLTRAAGALDVPVAELIRRLAPVEVAGRLEIPAVVHATLFRAVSKLDALAELAAPAVFVEATRRFALGVSTSGWRPRLDPVQWLPDTAEVAATVDADRWPPLVMADMSRLVLFAALCAVDPAARSVPAGDPVLRWRRLGGSGPPTFGTGPVPEHAVAVGLVVSDETVERLDHASLPDGGALLAVTLADPDP